MVLCPHFSALHVSMWVDTTQVVCGQSVRNECGVKVCSVDNQPSHDDHMLGQPREDPEH